MSTTAVQESAKAVEECQVSQAMKQLQEQIQRSSTLLDEYRERLTIISKQENPTTDDEPNKDVEEFVPLATTICSEASKLERTLDGFKNLLQRLEI